jgi:hypothetical protein
MGTLKEYQCNGGGYTITGTKKGRTWGAMNNFTSFPLISFQILLVFCSFCTNFAGKNQDT